MDADTRTTSKTYLIRDVFFWVDAIDERHALDTVLTRLPSDSSSMQVDYEDARAEEWHDDSDEEQPR